MLVVLLGLDRFLRGSAARPNPTWVAVVVVGIVVAVLVGLAAWAWFGGPEG